MELVLQFKKQIILRTPVSSELEYFQLVNKLEREIKGTALAWLESNGSVYLKRPINKPPINIYNSLDDTWYSFEYFRFNSHKFPIRTVLLFANQSNDKSKKIAYGFF